MSIAEFCDGLPSYSEKNFSRFEKKKPSQPKRCNIYLSTNGGPPSQRIAKDNSNILIRYLNTQKGKKIGDKKRVFDKVVEENEEKEELSSSCSKRSKMDDEDQIFSLSSSSE